LGSPSHCHPELVSGSGSNLDAQPRNEEPVLLGAGEGPRTAICSIQRFFSREVVLAKAKPSLAATILAF